MKEFIRNRFKNKSLVILGFGREGQATYQLLRQAFPEVLLTIADANEKVIQSPLVAGDRLINFITGDLYLKELHRFDVIFRSPGIPVWPMVRELNPGKTDFPAGFSESEMIGREQLTSQTELFLEYYGAQVIGVTGTKGKSTTSSLIHHIFKTAGRDTLLAGNIGNPVFHFIDQIKADTQLVVELSSHQLEFLTKGPRIAVLLNLFQEHLDAYPSYEAYKRAKINMAQFQEGHDTVIYNADDPQLTELLHPFLPNRQGYPFSLQRPLEQGTFIDDGAVCFSDDHKVTRVWNIHQDRYLRGDHNLKNIMAAVNAAMICGISIEDIEDGIATFKGLEHRLEYVGEFDGIFFYNDSIATIPEACMEAVKAVPGVDTLIAGGFDRGIDYHELALFLGASSVRNLILVGAAGRRILEEMKTIHSAGKKIFHINRFNDFREIAFRETRRGGACLLSPAAASYDEFANFEERGKRFRTLVAQAAGSDQNPVLTEK